MGRYFGRETRYSREEIELQAQQAIEARVNMGRPPAEDWVPIEARLAAMDREMAARAPAEQVPAPQAPAPAPRPRRKTAAGAGSTMSVTEVRLPASAKAGRPVRAATTARTSTAAPAPRTARKTVAAKER